MCTDCTEVLEGTPSSHTEYVENPDDGECGGENILGRLNSEMIWWKENGMVFVNSPAYLPASLIFI